MGVFVLIGAGLFGAPLRNWAAQRATLANPAPPPELVEEMIEGASDRVAAILAAWHRGNIVHRQVAVRQVSRALPPPQPWPAELETLVVTATFDADLSVRQAALACLGERRHPATTALAAAQLSDPDPQAKLLGLNALRGTPAEIGLPAVVPLLDEADPEVVTPALKLLERWSGETFGVKFSETGAVHNAKTGLWEFSSSSQAKARAGAERAKAWWAKHYGEFARPVPEAPAAARAVGTFRVAGDFQLPSIEGRTVRLSDFRGRIVLLNFWTTWCPACVGEIPALIALQEKHGDKLVILGISLDYVPDSHGHIGGHAAVEEQTHHAGDHDDHEPTATAFKRVRDKVIRTAKARGINYPVLLDEKNEVGGRFNGGELPTTVIIDAQGKVRRRFVGARSLPVFEAMMVEASQPR